MVGRTGKFAVVEFRISIEQKQQEIEQQKQRADKLAAQLKALGIEPEK